VSDDLEERLRKLVGRSPEPERWWLMKLATEAARIGAEIERERCGLPPLAESIRARGAK
jgi:hypothetical protein